MKKIAVFTLVIVLVAAWDATAQQPSHQHHASDRAAAPTTPSAPAPGAQPPMPGAMMPGGMCGMMMGSGPGGGGPAESPRMMQMRGEMMKAMGDIMMKHGRMMETPVTSR